MKQKLLISTLTLFFMGCASMPGGVPEAYAGQLVSVVEGRYIVPPIVSPMDSIANGGFFISGYGRGGSIGDGGDEATAWFHSFRIDRVQWDEFETALRKAGPETFHIRSARLELKYTPRSADSYNANDYVQITGLKGIPINQFDGFIESPPTSPRERQTVSIELLADDRYTSEDIIGILRDPSKRHGHEASGIILMRYSDDAIIHYAKLTLKY